MFVEGGERRVSGAHEFFCPRSRFHPQNIMSRLLEAYRKLD
jgi:hypothetical protein